jgi:hypothetical protein
LLISDFEVRAQGFNHHHFGLQRQALYIAGAVLTGFTVAAGVVGRREPTETKKG